MTTQPLHLHAYVDGKHLETEQSIPRENPANPDEIVGYAPLNTRDDARHAIDVAAQAF